MPADLKTVKTPDQLHRRCLCVDISNPTSLVLFSIPGIPGSHQLTGVVLISMDGGQNILTVKNEKQINLITHGSNVEIQYIDHQCM